MISLKCIHFRTHPFISKGRNKFSSEEFAKDQRYNKLSQNHCFVFCKKDDYLIFKKIIPSHLKIEFFVMYWKKEKIRIEKEFYFVT